MQQVRRLMSIVLCIVLFTTLFIGCEDVDNPDKGFAATAYHTVDDTVYYTNTLLLEKAHTPDAALAHYAVIAAYLKEHDAGKVVIANLNQQDALSYYNAYPIVDDVWMTDTYYSFTVENDEVSYVFPENSLTPIESLPVSADRRMPDDELTAIAFSLAKDNAAEMGVRSVEGTYHFEYSEERGLCYVALFANDSHIYLNAETGAVIDTYFFDGIVY